MLKYRILTACLLIPFVLMGIFFLSSEHFTLMAAFIFLGASYEWGQLCFKNNYITIAFCSVFALLMFGYHYFSHLLSADIVLLGSAFWIVPLLSVITFQSEKTTLFQSKTLRVLSGLLFLLLAWIGLSEIHAQPLGGFLIISLFLLIWSADTFAYFVGRAWGKTKLSPISPGKSLQGAVGGIAGSLVVGGLIYVAWHMFALSSLPTVLNHFPLWLLFVSLISVLSIAGDLFESLLKRISGVKDSGKLLPGHGGLLDRIDSLLPTLPLYAIFIAYWGPVLA
ncbi:phosphatidate cytidylyltransferase [Candidatus Berkiella cookevillensis]|uniref:Phosphatidate cytidylyltransferase n=2 Tax=Candidatus Berkiella cookevillensis TaxID=437022 RepID=A0A0Q9YHK6_9GAMM|nr:phosphatidate cytidylyltransferase [Candidatus Berkiella cookevillensis]